MFTINEDHPLHTKKKFPVGKLEACIPVSLKGKMLLSYNELIFYNQLVEDWCDSGFPQEIPLDTNRLAEVFTRDIRTIERRINKLIKVGFIEDCGYKSGPGKKRLISIALYNPAITERPIPRPYRKPLKVPDNVINLIKYWESKDNLPKMKWPFLDGSGIFINPTKVFKETVNLLQSLLNGTLFEKMEHLTSIYKIDPKKQFTEREIRMSIDRFYISAWQLQYFPPDKDLIRTFSLSKFIWNPFGKNVKFWSWFLFCHKTYPELLSVRIRKPVIDISETCQSFRQKYAEVFCGGDEDHFTESDEMNFIYAGNELAWRVTALKKHLKAPLNSISASQFLIESIQANSKIGSMNTDVLTQHPVFSDLATYLQKRGILTKFKGRRMK
ncbi:hypothetical protein M1316_01175 [Candidatus Parvarchaeota archaeon]|nr:hypothetical protein [Candidatus Parvarchaeota archaeon]